MLVRQCSNFILLHIAVQLSQHHLLKRMFLLHCIFLPPLSKIRYPQVGFISGFSVLFHWFIFIFLCKYYTIFMTVALQYSLKSGLFLQLHFSFSRQLLLFRVFSVSIKLCKFLFQLCEKSHWEFDKDCIESGRLPWVVQSFSQY